MDMSIMIKNCCVFINDDLAHQALFTRALKDVCPETLCITTANGRDALHFMIKEKVIPSYIFVELNMPEMDGIEFLRTIKGIHSLKEVPVIVHSTSPQPNKVIELKESGAL